MTTGCYRSKVQVRRRQLVHWMLDTWGDERREEKCSGEARCRTGGAGVYEWSCDYAK